MFRQLDAVIRDGTEAALQEGSGPAAVQAWMRRHLGWTLWQLEEHHHLEGHHYFPLFRRAEPRLAAGFELLERDHEALHEAIGGNVERANVVLANEARDAVACDADLARFRALTPISDASLSATSTTKRIWSSHYCWSAASSRSSAAPDYPPAWRS